MEGTRVGSRSPIGQRILIVLFAVGWAFVLAAILQEKAADGTLRWVIDRPWPEVIGRVGGMIAIACGGPVMLTSIYYYGLMQANDRPERRTLANFTAPISIFVPQFYTETGNRYRRLCLLWLVIFLLLLFVAFVCKSFVNGFVDRVH